MNRQLTILAVCGGVVLLLCCGVGFFLFTARSGKNAMRGERDRKTTELERIYAADVFPSEANIARYGEDAEAVAEWRVAASNLFRKGALRADETFSPSRFKQHLMESVRHLNAQFRTPAEKGSQDRAARRYGFDFDRYLGDILPAAGDVPRLSRQLEMIRLLCAGLHEVGVKEITGVEREKFDRAEEKPSGGEEEQPRRRRRDRRRPKAGNAGPASGRPSAKPYAGKERFVLSFKARPDVLIGSLNRLAAMDLFAVVAEVEIGKLDAEGRPGDMLKDFIKRRLAEAKAEAEGRAGAEGPQASAQDGPPVRRVVTDPELDPPSAVKLVVDVYTF